MSQEVIPARRWDIDWLRVVIIAFLVPYHTYTVFNIRDEWFVKNAQLSTGLNWFLYLADAVGLQLLFLLAGAASWFALRHRRGGEYARLRLKRLLVPLIFGLMVIVPPQSYLGLRHHTGYTGSFLAWYPRFFTFSGSLTDYPSGQFTPAHLWFIFNLLLYSLVALPLFLALKHRQGQRVISGLASACSRPAAIFLWALPVIAIERLLDLYSNPLYFLFFFITGYLLLADPRFEEAIRRVKGWALVVGLLALVLYTLSADGHLGAQFNLPGWIGNSLRRGLVSWLLVVGILGYARQLADGPPKRRLSRLALGYLGEGSYPLYILHQTVIVVLAFFVVQGPAGVSIKFLIIAGGAYLITIILYELLVRRTNLTRFLLGMRPRDQETVAEIAPHRHI